MEKAKVSNNDSTVSIVLKTQGVDMLLDKTAEEIVAYIARVSSTRQNKTIDYKNLINYLIDNKHWSPFDHYFYTMEICTSLAIGTQLLRHTSFKFQQLSRRYNCSTHVEYIEPELRMKADGGNRQGSSDIIAPEYISNEVSEFLDSAFELYDKMITNGVAPESARMILPQCSKTIILMTGSIRSWIHFLQLRTDMHSQKEMQVVANKIKELLSKESDIFSYSV